MNLKQIYYSCPKQKTFMVCCQQCMLSPFERKSWEYKPLDSFEISRWNNKELQRKFRSEQSVLGWCAVWLKSDLSPKLNMNIKELS